MDLLTQPAQLYSILLCFFCPWCQFRIFVVCIAIAALNLHYQSSQFTVPTQINLASLEQDRQRNKQIQIMQHMYTYRVPTDPSLIITKHTDILTCPPCTQVNELDPYIHLLFLLAVVHVDTYFGYGVCAY